MNKFSIALFPVKKNVLNALNSKCTTDEHIAPLSIQISKTLTYMHII